MKNRAATEYIKQQYRLRRYCRSTGKASEMALRLTLLAKEQIYKIGSERNDELIERLMHISAKSTKRALRISDKANAFYRYRTGFCK